MLLRHRTPDIDTTPAILSPGLEHLDQRSVALLRWLNAARLDFILVGSVARAVHGLFADDGAPGPVAIVPAPYLRNHERLVSVLSAHEATLRTGDPASEVRVTAETLARGQRWRLRVDGHDLDVEGTRDGAGYQELLYESRRITLAPGIAVEVAAPEDLQSDGQAHRSHVAPEFRVTRTRGGEDTSDAVRAGALQDG